MDILAVIPALHAAGRHALPGRPPELRALEQARSARRVTQIAMMTSDDDIARLAREAGAAVVGPPAGGSTADGSALLTAALAALDAGDGFASALCLLLDPALAFRTAETIDGAIDHLLLCGADTLVAVSALPGPLWMQDEGGVARVLPEGPAARQFVESGCITIVRTGIFEQTGELPAGRVVLYEVPALASLRLDEAADWSDADLLRRHVADGRAKVLLRDVKLLVFDFDGVMTDNRVLVFEDGREAVLCNRGDGLGLDLLKKSGLPLAVISKEVNPVVSARCRKLKIPCEQGIEDKLEVLARITAELGLTLADVAYMGNDINDLACMTAVGVAIAPCDSHPQALRAARLVTAAAGGFGAVREVSDLLMALRAEAPGPAD